MPLPTTNANISYAALINKGLLYLRLPLIPPDKDLNELGHQEDAALLWQLCDSNNRVELSKGWWFNTFVNYEVDEIGTTFHVVPTPGDVDLLSVTNVRRHCRDAYDYQRYKIGFGSNVITTENYEEATHKGLITYTIPVSLPSCPPVYSDYILKMSAFEMAKVLDIPFNAELVDIALIELEREQAKHREKLNVFTRRR